MCVYFFLANLNGYLIIKINTKFAIKFRKLADKIFYVDKVQNVYPNSVATAWSEKERERERERQLVFSP